MSEKISTSSNRSRVVKAGAAGAAVFLIVGAGIWVSRPSPSDQGSTPLEAESPEQKVDPALASQLSERDSSNASSAAAASQAKLKILEEILKTRNDNDPRLDTELKRLDPETREAFRQKYREMPQEDLNGRGTIVFLLGRSLEAEADFQFLEAVLREKPCLSPSRCSAEGTAPDSEHVHIESGMEVTLAYPELVAIESLKRVYTDSSTLKSRAEAALRSAFDSETPIVRRKLSQIFTQQEG